MEKSNTVGHRCIIGSLHLFAENRLVTADDLMAKRRLDMDLNNRLECDPNASDLAQYKLQVYTMDQYANPRVATNLWRFKHCPECGARINWAQIARLEG
mgnify:CR=1 FL=1